MKLQQVLDQVDSGDIAPPEFQRGYVWNREQVRGLFTSLYRGYPIGGFMTWNTKAKGPRLAEDRSRSMGPSSYCSTDNNE
jgi:uncharacterized protein with ParB-like and HNH nuclease domain